MKRRTLFAVAAAAVAIGLVVGTVVARRPTQPAPRRSVVPSPTVDPSPSMDPNDAWFLRAVRIDFPDAPAEGTIRLGHTYCDLMDSGVTLKRIIEHADAKYLAGVVGGAAIVVFCPQHEDQIHQ
jgi:uncharacterized protein DUF732